MHWINLVNLAHSTRLIGSPLLKIKSSMAMSIRSVACRSCLVPMSIICCILGGSEVADFHLLQSDWENDKELDAEVDAAIDDGDSSCRRFCLDSLVDHVAAKVLAPEMVRQSLGCITVLEESRTTTIAGNKAMTAAPARDGLTIIIYGCVDGYARTVPN
jgi:hypothetical protein